jgi:hypothetical protein
MLDKQAMRNCLAGGPTPVENVWTLFEAIREFGVLERR